MVVLFLIFEKSHAGFHRARIIHSPHCVWEFSFTLNITNICCLFSSWLTSWRVQWEPGSSDLHFLMAKNVEHFESVYWTFVFHLLKTISLFHLLTYWLYYLGCLRIFQFFTYSRHWFSNRYELSKISSALWDVSSLLFLLLYRSFSIYCDLICRFLELFSELWSPFQKALAYIYIMKCFPCVLLWQLRISGLMFGIDAVQGERCGSSNILSHAGIHISEHHLLKSLELVYCWLLSWKCGGCNCVDLILGVRFYAISLCACFEPIICCFCHSTSVV